MTPVLGYFKLIIVERAYGTWLERWLLEQGGPQERNKVEGDRGWEKVEECLQTHAPCRAVFSGWFHLLVINQILDPSSPTRKQNHPKPSSDLPQGTKLQSGWVVTQILLWLPPKPQIFMKIMEAPVSDSRMPVGARFSLSFDLAHIYIYIQASPRNLKKVNCFVILSFLGLPLRKKNESKLLSRRVQPPDCKEGLWW